MEAMNKALISGVGSGFAALAILPILIAIDNDWFAVSATTMYFAGVGLTWLGNRLFGVIGKKEN